ncbi:GDSL esterase/lipase-like [Dorcoceras hygrometricum]|uniref:GDSL esterase/lipase-like n=1 Tax=Dorcoceras hygrometricum TaxID=472368 RepID=A0A2Z7CCN5_9LAMI|nr:GDSL esterase/lipase-like [Dorcoceras hygrometricum]
MGPYILLLWLLLLAKKSTSAKIPAIIVFGDSSVDAGNNNHLPTIARSNFEPYGRDFVGGRPTGRFSNGRIPTDFISEAIGLKSTVPAYLDPSFNISDFAVGVTFASAGTGVIPLWKELEYFKDYQTKLRGYLGDEKANQTIGDAVYIVSIGTNDFLENYYAFPPRRRTQYNVDQYQQLLIRIARNFTVNLYNLGARKISIGGLPPHGLHALRDLVTNLTQELAGVDLVFSNPYYILLQIVKRPSLFGFDVSGVGCCATGMFEMGYACNERNPFTCRDANKYVFWDAFHPTERANQIISDHVVKTALYKFLV